MACAFGEMKSFLRVGFELRKVLNTSRAKSWIEYICTLVDPGRVKGLD